MPSPLVERIKKRSAGYQRVVDACQWLLQNDSMALPVRNYLDSRISRSAQLKYGFGYFPPNEQLSRLLDMMSAEELAQCGVVYQRHLQGGFRRHGHFSDHNLLMPLHDAYGNIVALLGRTLLSGDEQEAAELKKYKYSFGYHNSLFLFGLLQAKEAIINRDLVIGVEGQFDAIACHEVGINNVVALGCSSLSRWQLFQLRCYTHNLLLMFDSDDGGYEGKRKIKEKYSGYATIRTAGIPAGYKDIDEFIRKEQDLTWRQSVIDQLRTMSFAAQEICGSQKESFG
jgi:DNA primase